MCAGVTGCRGLRPDVVAGDAAMAVDAVRDVTANDAAPALRGCPRPGFGAGVSWPIPRRALRLAEQGDASAAFYLHATIDLDGDERPDFVVTFDTARPPDELAWTFFRNTGAGFDATPVRWPVPRRALRLEEQGDASAAFFLHTTFDIDGDLRPDFVVTFDRAGAAGDGAWLVYRNNGAGFDAAPIRWPVPLRLFRANDQGDASAASTLFTTVDVDGDRRPDLVVTYDRSTASGSAGTSWSVYRNTGTGFAPTAESWTVPVRALRVSEQGDAGTAVSLHALLDMDGDERLDFVRTYDISGAAGDGVWLVHRNTGHGFAEPPIQWRVPGRVFHHTDQGSTSAATILFLTQPRLRRGPQDFVVTFDRTGAAGDTTWLGYENTGGGFASVPTAWPIPFRASRASEQGDASAAIALHASYDLDGDRAIDFVQTFGRDGLVGVTEWRLHRGCVR